MRVAVLGAASWSIRCELALPCLELRVGVSVAVLPVPPRSLETVEVLRCTVGPRSEAPSCCALCFMRRRRFVVFLEVFCVL